MRIERHALDGRFFAYGVANLDHRSSGQTHDLYQRRGA